LVPWLSLLINLELFFFSAYVLLLTLALGIDGFKEDSRVADAPKDLGDAFFGIGSVFLVVLALVVWAYLAEEFAASNGANFFISANYLFFIGFFVIVAATLVAIRREREAGRELTFVQIS